MEVRAAFLIFLCTTPIHRQLKQAAHCTRIYIHNAHTWTGGPGSECVELIWACAPVQFTIPHNLASPSFIGRRSFQDSEIRYIYNGYYTTELSKMIELPIICLSRFCHKSLSQHDPQGRACKPHSASSGPLWTQWIYIGFQYVPIVQTCNL